MQPHPVIRTQRKSRTPHTTEQHKTNHATQLAFPIVANYVALKKHAEPAITFVWSKTIGSRIPTTKHFPSLSALLFYFTISLRNRYRMYICAAVSISCIFTTPPSQCNQIELTTYGAGDKRNYSYNLKITDTLKDRLSTITIYISSYRGPCVAVGFSKLITFDCKRACYVLLHHITQKCSRDEPY